MLKFTSTFKKFLRNSNTSLANFLYNAQEHAAYKTSEWRDYYSKMVTDKEIDYLNFRKDGNISYLPAGKTHMMTADGEWSKEGRQDGKPSKVIRKLLTEEGLRSFKDADFEVFANSYKAVFFEENLEFELLPSTEIPRVYDAPTNSEGTLGNSCMKGLGKTGYLEIYKECKKLQILALWKNKKTQLAGRCLVWTATDHNNEECIVADRFYVSKDHYYELFKEYCTENGFTRKNDYAGRGDKDNFVGPKGGRFSRRFKVETPTNFDIYPYIDTFCYGGEGWLSNSQMGAKYDYARTGGMRHGGRRTDREYMIIDNITQAQIPEREAVVINAGSNNGRVTHRNNTITLLDEYGNQKIYWKSESNPYIKYFAPLNQWFPTGQMTYCEYDRTFIPTAAAMWSSHHNSFLYKPNAIRVGHQWYDMREIGRTLVVDPRTGKTTRKQTELFTATSATTGSAVA